MHRCDWCGKDPLYMDYHDNEWGSPLHDERSMFEFLLLEGAQAGLSWITILRKRQGYKEVFDNFDVETLAAYSDASLDEKLLDTRIVRNRAKVYAARKNAQATLALYASGASLLDYFWGFVDGKAVQNRWRAMDDVPPHTPLSHTISKDLKQRGFTFVGPTIIYAHMQATGIVNDHLIGCYRYQECAALA